MNTKSKYAKVFDSRCVDWEANSEWNETFFKVQENLANDLLKCKGYLFLNEVYTLLDLPMTRTGQLVGWRYDSGEFSDNKVCFDINKIEGENAYVLDFNVDGIIIDLLED